jgi:hypothetical protein
MDAPPRSPPRYRTERRADGEAAVVVGFADLEGAWAAQLAVGVGQLLRARTPGEVVVVDQGDETVVARRPVRLEP